MLVVTGGAGFIGSNIVRGLNERGINDILVVDDLTKIIKRSLSTHHRHQLMVGMKRLLKSLNMSKH